MKDAADNDAERAEQCGGARLGVNGRHGKSLLVKEVDDYDRGHLADRDQDEIPAALRAAVTGAGDPLHVAIVIAEGGEYALVKHPGCGLLLTV
jgi:hypothetical protein